MRKKTVKRCTRPQCMEVYPEDTPSKYCDCGALLQVTEIEIPDRKTFVPKEGPGQRKKTLMTGRNLKVEKLIFLLKKQSKCRS